MLTPFSFKSSFISYNDSWHLKNDAFLLKNATFSKGDLITVGNISPTPSSITQSFLFKVFCSHFVYISQLGIYPSSTYFSHIILLKAKGFPHFGQPGCFLPLISSSNSHASYKSLSHLSLHCSLL